MAVQQFQCPNCGAPIDYDGEDVPTIQCKFCNTSAVVPPELRPKPARRVQPEAPEAKPAKRSGAGCVLVLVLVAIFIGGFALVSSIIANQTNKVISGALEPANRLQTELPRMILTAAATDLPATEMPAPTEAFTPTPGFARQQATFGGKGIGAGLLNDARYLAVDGTGAVYVADYQDGRIQVFDAQGKFSHGWQVGDSKTIIAGMAANHQGTLFVAYNEEIYRYEGATGKLLGKVDYANGPEFGDLTVGPDGGLVGMWYEGRWGMITSLDGHR